MKTLNRFAVAAMLIALAGWLFTIKTRPMADPPQDGQSMTDPAVVAAAETGAPVSTEAASGAYRVLAPLESGNLLLFPVVSASGKTPAETPFLTLDEGLKSGEVEITEAGRARGLVRPRGPVGAASGDGRGLDGWRPIQPPNDTTDFVSDQVNTLVLVNRSKKPLLLLAGEIVTGGKQDRIVAADRIVPGGADPVDLSVFCIEPGRWQESSATFGASAKSESHGLMVQPSVREKAMAAADQQQVWSSVRSIVADRVEAKPAIVGSSTSYARVMQSDAVSEQVDKAAAPIVGVSEQVLAKLRQEHAVGVVVAVHGEIVWADVFANTDLLSRYWTKLVRSYAAESLTAGEDRARPSVADAERFLNAPLAGHETAQGEPGVYRYHQYHGARSDTFVLESLLPGAAYEVHLSRMKLRGERVATPRPVPMHRDPIYVPVIPRPDPMLDPNFER
jgi:hypothetical protein